MDGTAGTGSIDPSDRRASTAASTSPAVVADRYELRSIIAEGGMGAVYDAWDTHLHRTVAVKVMHPEHTAEGRERAEREISIASHSHHPGLVEVLDVGVVSIDDESRRYIVMERVAGRSLQQVLADRTPDLRSVAEIGAQIADVLGYLHLRGILHLDVKPGNILIEATPTLGFTRRARLIDFGISQGAAGPRRAPGAAIIASAAYMSPEQVEGGSLTGASDVYSLGLVLLRCVTGKDEYPGDRTESAVLRLRRDPEIPDDLPKGWPQLLDAMTMRRPAGRPTAHDVAAEFTDLLRALRTPAPAPTPAARVEPEAVRLRDRLRRARPELVTTAEFSV